VLANCLSDGHVSQSTTCLVCDITTCQPIEEFARKSKVARVVIWIIWVKKVTQHQLVFEEDIENSCGKQIRAGWSPGSSDSSETGFKKKPVGVLRTDLRRGANCVTDSDKSTTQIDNGCRLVDDRVPANRERVPPHYWETDTSINWRIAFHQAVRQA